MPVSEAGKLVLDCYVQDSRGHLSGPLRLAVGPHMFCPMHWAACPIGIPVAYQENLGIGGVPGRGSSGLEPPQPRTKGSSGKRPEEEGMEAISGDSVGQRQRFSVDSPLPSLCF